MSKCIVVMGCYRSGTSAVAGILHHLGVNMGGGFQEPNGANPKGYFEDPKILRLNQTLYEADINENEGSYWEAYTPLNSELIRREENCPPDVLWGFKDPKWCLNAKKFWASEVRNSKVIDVQRDVTDTAISLMKSVGVYDQDAGNDKWVNFVRHYNREKAEYLKEVHHGSIKTVNFKHLLSRPTMTIESIVHWAGIPTNGASKRRAAHFIKEN